jgi:hypothetical protein
MDEKQNPTGNSPNEGEGNQTAARQYNKAQRRFAQSGKVEEKAARPRRPLTVPRRKRCNRLRRSANATALVKILPPSSSTAATRRPPRAP